MGHIDSSALCYVSCRSFHDPHSSASEPYRSAGVLSFKNETEILSVASSSWTLADPASMGEFSLVLFHWERLMETIRLCVRNVDKLGRTLSLADSFERPGGPTESALRQAACVIMQTERRVTSTGKKESGQTSKMAHGKNVDYFILQSYKSWVVRLPRL